MRDTCVTARDFSSKTNLSTWSIGQATTIRCIIQQYFISDSRYSCLPRWSSFCIQCVINILIETLENIKVKVSNSFIEIYEIYQLCCCDIISFYSRHFKNSPSQKIDLLIISIKFFNWKRRARIEIMRKEKINGSKISKRIKLKEKSTNP